MTKKIVLLTETQRAQYLALGEMYALLGTIVCVIVWLACSFSSSIFISVWIPFISSMMFIGATPFVCCKVRNWVIKTVK